MAALRAAADVRRTRANGQLPAVGRVDVHANAAPAAARRVAGRGVADRVAAPDVARDAFQERRYLGELARKKCFAAGGVRDLAQQAGLRVVVVGVVDADGVNDDVLAQGGVKDLREARMAGVVSAVADDHEDFSRLVPLVKLTESRGDGVEERGLSSRGRLIEGPPQLVALARERVRGRPPGPDPLVEAQPEELARGTP